MKMYLPWVLAIFAAFVWVQSLFFKFTGSEETEIIFDTIGAWMVGIDWLAPIAEVFSQYGGMAVGSVELIASVLVLIPASRLVGATIGFCVMSGAIFFHLFTPLGVNRIIDAQGNTDNSVLFTMACAVWLCCLALMILSRDRWPINSTF